MRLYVDGFHDDFSRKFQQTGQLTLSVSMMGAGLVLVANRPLVELLAGPGFYAGRAAVTWFAVAVLMLPFASLFSALRQISGTMGMTAAFAFLKLGVGVVLAVPMFRIFGMAGLAATFALVPLIDAAYGCVTGARNCGFDPWRLSGRLIITATAHSALIVAAGYLIASFPGEGPLIVLFGKPTHLPGWVEVVVGGSVALIGAFSLTRSPLLQK